MANSTADDGFMAELLLQEKDRLMAQLAEAQQKMAVEFSPANTARCGQITARLEKVCGQLQSQGYSTGDTNLPSAPSLGQGRVGMGLGYSQVHAPTTIVDRTRSNEARTPGAVNRENVSPNPSLYVSPHQGMGLEGGGGMVGIVGQGGGEQPTTPFHSIGAVAPGRTSNNELHSTQDPNQQKRLLPRSVSLRSQNKTGTPSTPATAQYSQAEIDAAWRETAQIGKTYYYNAITKATSWEAPTGCTRTQSSARPLTSDFVGGPKQNREEDNFRPRDRRTDDRDHGLPQKPNLQSQNVVDMTDPTPQRPDSRHTLGEQFQPSTVHPPARLNVSAVPNTGLPSNAPPMPRLHSGSRYSHIVKFKGQAFELECYICGANAVSPGHQYFDGQHGYYVHVTSSHPSERSFSVHEILQRAAEKRALRRVDDRDVFLIRNGQDPVYVQQPFIGNQQKDIMDVSDRTTVDDTDVFPNLIGEVPVNVHQPFVGNKQNDLPDDNARTTSSEAAKSTPAGPGNQGVSSAPAQGEMLDRERYPIVVFLDGAWVQIWCHICGANVCSQKGATSFGQFWKGLTGLTKHIVAGHKDVQTPGKAVTPGKGAMKEVAKLCGRRPLSVKDVGRIAVGQEPKTHIVKYVSFRKKFEEPPAVEKTPAQSGTETSVTGAVAILGANLPSSDTPTSGGGSSFAQINAPALNNPNSSLTPAAPASGNRRTSATASHNNGAGHTLLGFSGDDPVYGPASTDNTPATTHDEFQDIVPDAENAVNFMNTRGKRRKRVSTPEDEDEDEDDDLAETEARLFQRLKRHFE